jgi:hypothetical protein
MRTVEAISIAIALCCAFVAAVPIGPAQKSSVCGKRSTCVVTAIHDAGKDSNGAALSVAEVHLGLKDKPDDAPDAGCDAFSGNKGNGGAEYWLSGGVPKKLLALCNDGYGAADVGEDHVRIASNRLIHEQAGGSNWRWDVTSVFSLAPFQLLKETSCSYFDASGDKAVVTETDLIKFRAVAVEKDPRAQWGDEESGCPAVKQPMFDRPEPRPAAKLLSAYPIIAPNAGPDGALPNGSVLSTVPPGTTLGNCAMSLATDGSNGFVVFGKPAAAADAAELKVVALGQQTLFVQVFDPAPAASAGKSWIGGSHIEIWLAKDPESPPARANLDQLAVDLDGTVHEGIGDPAAPQVEHWKARDARGRPVAALLLHWKDESALPLGTAVVYSQSENGHQTRMVANTGMERGLPLFLPQIANLQTRCAVHAGRLDRL